jgi:hypothetical protein
MLRIMALLLIVIAGARAAEVTPAAPAAVVGDSNRLYLGVTLADTDNFDKPSPLRVTRVTSDSTFDRLGIREGDLISRINDTAVQTVDQFGAASAALKAGDAIKLEIERDGAAQTLSGTAEAPPRPRDVASRAGDVLAQAEEVKKSAERAATRSNLEDALRLVKELQEGLPEAAKEFKKIYPEGDFDVDIHIKVTSNKKEQAPEELKPAPIPETPAAAEAPAKIPTETK